MGWGYSATHLTAASLCYVFYANNETEELCTYVYLPILGPANFFVLQKMEKQ